MAQSLDTYITNAREKKVSDAQIKAALIAAGWQEDQVVAALNQSTNGLLPPPPPPQAHVGMWVGFLYILFFISLYVLLISIGIIFHHMVDKLIPDIKTASASYSDIYDSSFVYAIRGCIAAIIVSYPIFLILALTLKKQLSKQPIVRNLRSRKLLIYLTLIITFLIMLGHIIMTIYGFLSGSLTGNAIGHLLITVLVAGSLFGYFINEVKYDRKTQ